MQLPLLQDIVIIFALSLVVILICHRLRIPVLVGFLITGVAAGPHGLGLVGAVHDVETLAEIGVVLLLFSIGIEFSLRSLLEIKRSVLLGGAAQVVLTVLVTAGIFLLLDIPPGSAIFFGFLAALSSTAIVLNVIQSRAEIASPYGRTSLAILIFQDIIIVPMILFTPILAGASSAVAETLLLTTVKLVGILLLVWAGTKWIVPRLLHRIAQTRSRELFIISIITMCLGVAWLTSSIGLSLALGAFLAGLIISESEYSHHALSQVLSFKDLFTSFFFISIGMLLDVGYLIANPIIIVLVAIALIVLKSMIAGFVAFLLGLPFQTTVLTAFALSQIGEFSFILSKFGVEHGLIGGNFYQLFLAVSVTTMAATPFIIAISPRAADLVSKLPLPVWLTAGLRPVPAIEKTDLKEHLVIVGFGVNGRNVARAAKATGIPYIILEMNPDTVRQERARGEPIYFGNATLEPVLEHAGATRAKVIVVAIPDAAATERVTELARRLNPTVYLIVRTRYLQEMKPLHDLGANEVIPEEFETSVEIFARVLNQYSVPRADIERMIAELRADGYRMFRSLSESPESRKTHKLKLPDMEIAALRVCPGSYVAGRSVKEIISEKNQTLKVLAIQRKETILSECNSNFILQLDDVIYVLGRRDDISAFRGLCFIPVDGRD